MQKPATTTNEGASNRTDDAALVERLRAGEERAYEEMVREYSGQMLAVARRFLRSEEDALDTVQEAFISAFRALDRFEGQSKLSTWLHRIVVNSALMRLRKKSRRAERSIEELLPQFRSDGHPARPMNPWREDVAVALEAQEARALVREKIDELPDPYRTVLLLRDIEEYDTRETAELLEITENAVKTRLHRARLALRNLLDPYFRGEVA